MIVKAYAQGFSTLALKRWLGPFKRRSKWLSQTQFLRQMLLYQFFKSIHILLLKCFCRNIVNKYMPQRILYYLAFINIISSVQQVSQNGCTVLPS